MTDHSDLKWNNDEIAGHLRSAVEALTPDVLSRIDFTTPQEIYAGPSKTVRLYRRMRTAALAAAACLALAVVSGGVAGYQNRRVDSVIGIDVNPSIELSVNRRDKVLRAEALNADAREVLDNMDLENVDLDIAVNALIGSMVRHGYLDDLDNAILVTVANKDTEKAAVLRQDVVIDIEASLEEHKVQAVVYDQQALDKSEVQELAQEYGISYGKAYFLWELIEENDLSHEEMEAFSGMTMEEIAREIAERSYSVRGGNEADAGAREGGETGMESSFESRPPASQTTWEETPEASSESASPEPGSAAQDTSAPAESASQTAATEPALTLPETTESFVEDETGGKRVRIDYVDFENGYLNVIFREKVKWKNPTISVTDENGQSYPARIEDTGPDSCGISVKGLEGGRDYSFTLGGVAVREGGATGSVRGYFDTPDIADELLESQETEDDGEDDDDGGRESGTSREDGDNGSGTDVSRAPSDPSGSDTEDAARPDAAQGAEPEAGTQEPSGSDAPDSAPGESL